MFAFLAAIFILGLRYMRLLPAKEAEEAYATVETSSIEEASTPPDAEKSPEADSPPVAE